jgi:hypothetical protein
MLFWADILQSFDGAAAIFKNTPSTQPSLTACTDAMLHRVPTGAVAMEWGYESDHPFDANVARLARAGVPFFVCPGTSSWNSLLGRASNAVANIRAAAVAAHRHHGLGLLVGLLFLRFPPPVTRRGPCTGGALTSKGLPLIAFGS